MLSAAIRARSAFVRCCQPLGPSITSRRENPDSIELSKWTPILPSISRSNTSPTEPGTNCTDQIGNGSRGITSRLQIEDFSRE